MHRLLSILFVISLSTPAIALRNFQDAKEALSQIHSNNPYTLYCGCKYEGKVVDLKSCGYKVYKDPRRAARREWEHVVPAHAFGHSFQEWREGSPECVKRKKRYKGRKCAAKNPVFARMEGDLYNLYPEIGELNHLRSNFSMTDFGEKRPLAGAKTFGGCQAIIMDRKFEPMDQAKGVIARIYMYMDMTYPGRGIISNKNQKLFEAWDKMYPATEHECVRARRIEALQGNPNPVLQKACATYFSLEKKSQ